MDLQQLITVLIGLAASAYLIRRSLQVFRGKGGSCGSCPGCPSQPETDQLPVRKQLYTLDSKRNSAKTH